MAMLWLLRWETERSRLVRTAFKKNKKQNRVNGPQAAA